MRHGYVWAHPLEKVADISVEHHFEVRHRYIYVEHLFEVRHGYVVPTTIEVHLPYLPLQALTLIDLALALVPLLSTPIFFNYFFILGS
jgi:hypothetical protein